MTLNDFVDLIMYPFRKLIILLGSIEIFGMSLLSLIAAALVISVIFTFFVGQHSMPMGGGAVGRRTRRAISSGNGDSAE